MLDSLNSTLTRSTIATFFTRFGKEPKHDELTLDQAVMCLETELGRPESEKRRIGEDEGEGEGESGAGTPMMISAGGSGSGSSGGGVGGSGRGGALELEKLDFSGPAVHPAAVAGVGNEPLHITEPAQLPLSRVAPLRQTTDSSYDDSDEGDGEGEGSSGSAFPSGIVDAAAGAGDVSLAPPPSASGSKFKKARFRRKGPKSAKSKSKNTPLPSGGAAAAAADDSFERVINVRSCPLCHRPRMNDRAEVDIVTHMAVCASQDWNKVDRIVVGNFVTASQAQRKWYTRVLSKVSSGDYRLGAVRDFLFLPFFYDIDCD